MSQIGNDLGKILYQQRIALQLTLQELSFTSGVSSSHLGRIERGERFPSAHVLRKIAKPLGFDEDTLFTLAGFLPLDNQDTEEKSLGYNRRQLDPYVAKLLSEETVDVQRAVIGILHTMKLVSRAMEREN
jgi:transcriptional regulator with XRE-family HTH domain